MVVLGKHEQPLRGPHSSPPYPLPPQIADISKAKKIHKIKQNKYNLEEKNKSWCVCVCGGWGGLEEVSGWPGSAPPHGCASPILGIQ